MLASFQAVQSGLEQHRWPLLGFQGSRWFQPTRESIWTSWRPHVCCRFTGSHQLCSSPCPDCKATVNGLNILKFVFLRVRNTATLHLSTINRIPLVNALVWSGKDTSVARWIEGHFHKSDWKYLPWGPVGGGVGEGLTLSLEPKLFGMLCLWLPLMAAPGLI